MNILAFGASSSKKSINKQFVNYVAKQFENDSIELLDLNDFALPIFSVDYELEFGIPEDANRFYSKILNSDLIIISLAEHNGTYTAYFKNLFDWVSRIELKLFQGKKLFLVSTSPGARGGLGVMETALVRFPIHGAEILNHFSLPFFQKNFDDIKGIIDENLKSSFDKILKEVKLKLTID
jgi:chromate reductase